MEKETDTACGCAGHDDATPDTVLLTGAFFQQLPEPEVIDDMMSTAQKILKLLPSDEEILTAKLDCRAPDHVRTAAFTGKAVLTAISGAQGNVDPDDAFVAMVTLEQQRMILEAAGGTAAPGGKSCVFRCAAHQKACKKAGTNKHRCNFDGFLCRLNCFFKADTGIKIG